MSSSVGAITRYPVLAWELHLELVGFDPEPVKPGPVLVPKKEHWSYSPMLPTIFGPGTGPIKWLFGEQRKEKEIVLDILVIDDLFLIFLLILL